jgi:hypothetical protein
MNLKAANGVWVADPMIELPNYKSGRANWQSGLLNLCEPLCTLWFKLVYTSASLNEQLCQFFTTAAAGIAAKILFAAGYSALGKKIAADEPGRCLKIFNN